MLLGEKNNMVNKQMDAESIYDNLSAERKMLQDTGELPEWFTTGGWQVFKEKVLFDSVGYRGHVERIARELASVAPSFLEPEHPLYGPITSYYGKTWEECFYNILWSGDLAPSSPLIANGGTNRGCTVSCSGGLVDDSIYGFYESQLESAMLSKEGFGTSSYLGDIRARGTPFRNGGKANGSFPVLRDFVQLAKDVSQGSVRRGAWAGYLPVDHGDFDEWADALHKNPESMNIGWCFSKAFIARLRKQDEDAIRRFKKVLWIKMQTGKGYIFKTDHVNEQNPQMYKDLRLEVKASNLCTEIMLFSDPDHTFTCVLSSLNCKNYDKWKVAGGVFVATVLLDCNVTVFLNRARKILGLEKAVRFTEKGRALGLGLLGFHSYLQQNMIAMEEYEAHRVNLEIFTHLDQESLMASQWMAKNWGEPEWCKGYGVRNTHRIAIAPNLTSSILAGQSSQGIEPIIANYYIQDTPGGELIRISPEFLKIAKERNKYNKNLIKYLVDNEGSVQKLDWLSDHEKLVFKTAFEIDQRALLRLASARQRRIDQGQSLNLFFAAEEDEEYIAEIHKEALLDERIKSLYYIRTLAGVNASKDECVACQ